MLVLVSEVNFLQFLNLSYITQVHNLSSSHLPFFVRAGLFPNFNTNCTPIESTTKQLLTLK